MCGIAGILLDQRHMSADRLLAMSQTIRHRAPNDRGHVLLDSRATLSACELGETPASAPGRDLGVAHRRLAIVDLSGGPPPAALVRRRAEVARWWQARAALPVMLERRGKGCEVRLMARGRLDGLVLEIAAWWRAVSAPAAQLHPAAARVLLGSLSAGQELTIRLEPTGEPSA